MGYYGKPLGVPKPKGPDFEAPLVLDLIEARYLVENGLLEVYKVASSGSRGLPW